MAIDRMDLSAVIPVYNEETTIRDVILELVTVLETCCDGFEVLPVDDGSTDTTRSILTVLSSDDTRIQPVYLDGHYGQTAAIDAGIRAAAGNYIVLLDGDGQNDPSHIPEMMRLTAEYDVVCGWRTTRKDSFIRKISSKIANSIRQKVLDDTIPDIGCTLKLFPAEKIKHIVLYDGFHRFLPILLQIEGCSITNIPVNHRPRKGGTSKYGVMNRVFRATADMWVVRWMKKRKLIYKIQE